MGDNLGLTGAKLIFVMVERNGMSSDPKYTSDGFLYYEKVRNTITNYISFAISSLIISGAYLNHNWGQKDFINLMLWAPFYCPSVFLAVWFGFASKAGMYWSIQQHKCYIYLWQKQNTSDPLLIALWLDFGFTFAGDLFDHTLTKSTNSFPS